jgi:hypothetical protein
MAEYDVDCIPFFDVKLDSGIEGLIFALVPQSRRGYALFALALASLFPLVSLSFWRHMVSNEPPSTQMAYRRVREAIGYGGYASFSGRPLSIIMASS